MSPEACCLARDSEGHLPVAAIKRRFALLACRPPVRGPIILDDALGSINTGVLTLTLPPRDAGDSCLTDQLLD